MEAATNFIGRITKNLVFSFIYFPLGLTGGLAAPLIASAGAAFFGASLGFLGTTAGLAIIGSVFGAAGAGLTGKRM